MRIQPHLHLKLYNDFMKSQSTHFYKWLLEHENIVNVEHIDTDFYEYTFVNEKHKLYFTLKYAHYL